MRTQSKSNVCKIKELVKRALVEGYRGGEVSDYVHERTETPEFNTYECAWDDIERIISDTYNPYINIDRIISD